MHFKKILTGQDRFEGMYLWKPVKKKFLCFWVRRGEDMWLDDYGFIQVKGNLYRYVEPSSA